MMNMKSLYIAVFTFLLIIYAVITVKEQFYSSGQIDEPEHTAADTEQKDKWSLTEWYEAFPEEKEKAVLFQNLVQSDGVYETFSDAEIVKIAVAVPGIQKSDYWERNVTAFEARLKEINLPYSLKRYFCRPGEIQVQYRQLKKIMESDYDYLITTLDEFSDIKMIERIITTGKTEVILQNITTPLRRFANRQPFLYTGFDHEMGALLLADEYNRRFPEGGDWILLLYTDGLVSEQRGGAFRRVMEKNSAMSLKSVYLTEGKREKAKQAVLSAVNEYGSIDFIYSCATDVTVGAIEALESMNLTDSVFVNGWGGGSLELDLIQKERLNITVMRMNDDAAVAMAEAIRMDLKGEKNKVPLVYSGKFEIVDLSKKESIEQLKIRAFRYSEMVK